MAILFALAISPEPSAKLLTSPDGWEVQGQENSRVMLPAFPVQARQVRRSAIESPGGLVFRTWTPDNGVVPLTVISAPFRPAAYMSVAITGTNRTPEGQIHIALECEATAQRLDVFRGSVGSDAAEAIVRLPDGWCGGSARLKLVATEKNINAGAGSVFEISRLSYWKSSFIGRLPYLVASFVIFSIVMLAGAALGVRLRWHDDPAPIALAALGASALGALYLATAMPIGGRWGGAAGMAVLAALALLIAGREARYKAARALAPYAKVWCISGLVYFAVLGLAVNGIGYWEPSYRFWPAIWSGDKEQSWLFAEAIRRGWNLATLFGGIPVPTDYPPLIAGAYLLLTDVFAGLQTNNDGVYLTGQAYDAAAVALSALWAPICWWLLVRLRQSLDRHGRIAILLFIGSLPIVLFDTTYGWSKTFAIAFALAAFGVSWQLRKAPIIESQSKKIALAFMLGAFSILADISTMLFLAPLALMTLAWTRSKSRNILIGFIAVSIVLASWSLYKARVLPSANPMLKYLLTGDYAFGHPELSLWEILSQYYSPLSPVQWLKIKRTMLMQSFVPLTPSAAQIPMNAEYGSGTFGRLRAWDLTILSKGNLAIPVLLIIAFWGALRAFAFNRTDMVRENAPFVAMICVSLFAWLLMILGLLAPAIVPQWPHAALLGLALGGAIIVYGHYPTLFKILMVGVAAYTVPIWILSPLTTALHIDSGAALTLIVLGLWLSVYQLALFRAPSKYSQIGTIPQRHGLLAALKENASIQRIGNLPLWAFLTPALTSFALLFTTFIALNYIHQPLVDVNAFRQTQTALTAYWMLKEGWQLAYQTPVAGFPWSIPFEFPLYQMLVAGISGTFGFNLEAVGRFVSFVFLIACGWPAFAVTRRLNLPKTVPWVFCALLWTSPLNVYWGRTFMIETMALFFSFACMPFAIDVIRRQGGKRSALLFFIFASLGVLQKATTCGPVLLLLFSLCGLADFRKDGINISTLRRLIRPLTILGMPVLIGFAWAHYADVVKADNLFGRQLTSGALTFWNFGNISQRLSLETWRVVVWQRSFSQNAGGWLGVAFLLLPWLGGPKYRSFAWISLAALTLFVLPILIFTNLHFVHNYYQTGCLLFLIAALSIVIGGWLRMASGVSALTPLVTAAFMAFNLVSFYAEYGIVTARSVPEQDPRSVLAYTIGNYLRAHTKAGTGLAIFGQEWSSEIAFQAQRKSITAPESFNEYKQVWQNPQAYLGDIELGAIVICPSPGNFPSESDVQKRFDNEPGWRLDSVGSCQILLRSDAP